MSKFDYKKEITDSLKDGAIISAVTIGTFFLLKYAFKTTPPTAKLDGMDVMKLGSGICLGVLVKDYCVYKKWITE